MYILEGNSFCDSEFRYLALSITRKQTPLYYYLRLRLRGKSHALKQKGCALSEFLKILHDCRIVSFAVILDFPVCGFEGFQVFLGLIFSYLPFALFLNV